jgi:hypothetical protein
MNISQECMVGDAHLSYRTWGFFGITVPHPNILRLAGGSTPKICSSRAIIIPSLEADDEFIHLPENGV